MNEQFYADVRNYFKNTDDAYYFISATNFNLIDMHNWVNDWKNINFLDCYGNSSTTCLIPEPPKFRTFSSIDEINEFLLDSPEIERELKSARKKKKKARGIFLFFNEAIEKKCKALDLDLLFPKHSLREQIDSKIFATEIGNEAGVPSVENALAKVRSYSDLLSICQSANLGNDVVVQTPFGDSGKTTFFIASEEEYLRYSKKIEAEDKVKIMKRINCAGAAIEACAASTGTYVGPLLGELIGMQELTPYPGGWCGNELHEEQFSENVRSEIHLKTERLGNVLYRKGYRGYFEVDYLIDLDSEKIYLGEINPRLTGISALTNLSPFCQSTVPLFLFHLLEFAKKDIPVSSTDYNSDSLKRGAMGTTSQLVLKADHSGLRRVTSSPASGVYRLDAHGNLELVSLSSNPSDKLEDPALIYLLRILKEGDFSYFGADKVILFLNVKLTSDRGTKLNEAARSWVGAVNDSFKTEELNSEELITAERYTSPTSMKGPL